MIELQEASRLIALFEQHRRGLDELRNMVSTMSENNPDSFEIRHIEGGLSDVNFILERLRAETFKVWGSAISSSPSESIRREFYS